MAVPFSRTKYVHSDVISFCQHGSGLKLRSYQEEVATAVVDSVIHRKGMTFVVIFPRQSGKNELQAQIETYLLLVFSKIDAEMVKASPTWKPQTLNAMRRLERVLYRNLITQDLWEKESGYIFRIDKARIFFMSGSPTANVVGATANVLLECDEAQDVLQSKWDKDFAPMAASTRATRVFWGTAWTSRTLLARERRMAEEEEKKDGIRRVWVLTAEDVRKEVEPYGEFVDEQVRRLGRNHPLVKTQFFSEEIDAQAGMFPPARRALMRGEHPCQEEPIPGHFYAMTIDVAGEDEAAQDEAEAASEDLRNPGRDSTSVTIFDVDLSALSDPLIKAPIYRSVARYNWTGTKHTRLYSQLKGLAEGWRIKYLVVDSTGVGQGLASFLEKALPNVITIPYLFTPKSKSDLGWKFLAVIETNRFKEFTSEQYQSYFWQQVEYCQSEVLDGPNKIMRWGVPDGTRDEKTGELIHDDEVLSSALISILDDEELSVTGPVLILPGRDPLKDMEKEW